MEPLYNRDTITELIPQRHPMIEVDAFCGIDTEGVAHTRLEVRADNLLCEDGRLSVEGLTEHMAQSAAARAGYLAVQRGEEVHLGFIGAVSTLTVGRLPLEGEVLDTAVEVLEQVMNIALIAVRSCVGEEEVASCRMKIYTEE